MTTGRGRYRRRRGIAWREEGEARQEAIEALAAGEDASSRGTLLLVVSGQIFELNLVGADVWKLCDGERTVAQIVDELIESYEVSREELERDVRAFVADMEGRGWLERA